MLIIGTSKGLIFETEIVLEGEKFFTSGFSSSLEQYWRQVNIFQYFIPFLILNTFYNKLPNYLPLYGNKEVDGLVCVRIFKLNSVL